MNLKPYLNLILIFLISSCSQTKKEGIKLNKEFTINEAKDLAEILNSTTHQNLIVEQTTIGDSLKSERATNELTYLDSIWQLVNQNVLTCKNPKIQVQNKEKWSFCSPDTGLDLFIVEYEENNIVFTEKYLTRRNKLIYAVEWEKRTADMSDEQASYWNCEYIVKDNIVLDNISLGMGKTEDESFELEHIITRWNSRKTNLIKLKI